MRLSSYFCRVHGCKNLASRPDNRIKICILTHKQPNSMRVCPKEEGAAYV